MRAPIRSALLAAAALLGGVAPAWSGAQRAAPVRRRVDGSDALRRGFYWAPGRAKTLKQATVYLSAGGPAAGAPKPYTIMLSALSGAFNGPVIATSTQTVYLNGNASQNLASQFPFTGSLSIPASTKSVAFKFTIVNPGNGSKLSFNVGPCGLGTKACSNLPTACSALTETNDATTLPLSTVRRKGLAVKLLGN